MNKGNSLESLFMLNNCKSKRISSYDKSGGNHDWLDVPAGKTLTFADIKGCGIVRHIWCTTWVKCEEKPDENEEQYLRKLVIRAYWDDEKEPSIEAPLGDFFGVGFGKEKPFQALALSANPQDGRAFNCFFPMPFKKSARFTIENPCKGHCNFYFYVDYEEHESLPQEAAYFHAQFRREADTNGWAPREAGLLDREKLNDPNEPKWYPAAWGAKNTDGKDNYVILEAEGKGKYVGCNLNIDVFERQANDWYGEGDDMIFIDGEAWPPSLHGTGTEDYFNTAFCPTQEYSGAYSGITRYSGDKAGFNFGGQNSMYRHHICDPVHFEKEIVVTVEHGHANKLSNDYSSTAYWYQTEPHKPFPSLPSVEQRIARKHKWDE